MTLDSQVGKYKRKLEAQGWVYEMQVSFLEIYNEQIRDLLRGGEGSKVREGRRSLFIVCWLGLVVFGVVRFVFFRFCLVCGLFGVRFRFRWLVWWLRWLVFC